MTIDIPRRDYTPIPFCQMNNVQEWRSRVIEAFAMNGMADYLFNESTLDERKTAIGMAIILSSLPEGLRAYLTKTGYDFRAKQPDPRKLFALVQTAVRRCDSVLKRENLLYEFYHVQKKTDESAEQYLQRIVSMRNSLKHYNIVPSDLELTRVALFGLRTHADTSQWAMTRIRDDLSANNLSFKTLAEKLIDFETSEKKKRAATGLEADKQSTKTHPTAKVPAQKAGSNQPQSTQGQANGQTAR
ncbi:hypothetical protein DL546_007737 [Coniochaeta pulveracea]|uniref:Uncharacterized protein n=1 Tax=Coniochaeta pulveracea TaxID=177199 RepID=A0A420YGK0_9PEZI|nr:hypothetical protein DL546_007737 [Coniochaeta pulveracea]